MASIFKMKSGKWRAQVRELGSGSASKVLGTKAEARKWAATERLSKCLGQLLHLEGLAQRNLV